MAVTFKTRRERLTQLYNELVAFAISEGNTEVGERARELAWDIIKICSLPLDK